MATKHMLETGRVWGQPSRAAYDEVRLIGQASVQAGIEPDGPAGIVEFDVVEQRIGRIGVFGRDLSMPSPAPGGHLDGLIRVGLVDEQSKVGNGVRP